ncbi:CPBP family intramembrane glutamic endopeptidase [Microbacterium pumilum]|uniref:CAAX prenyl protease 2/Lysostaphin resistance protein A-like domain-containing protein n=1 Tax=Microbacterium pumilum TaxID=344165 RepID=A0ABP5D7W5_9MICO
MRHGTGGLGTAAAPPPAATWTPAPASTPWVIGAAWLTTLLVSTVPVIFWTELIGPAPAWLTVAQITVPAVLFVVTLVSRRMRPLWRFSVVMCLLLVLIAAMPAVDLSMPWVQGLFGATAFDQRMQAEQTVKLLAALLMVAALLLLGLKPKDFFLRLGMLTAPIRPVPVLGFPHADSWRRFGLIWGFGITAALGIVQYFVVRPTAADFAVILPMVPSIIFYAAVNAFTEEMTYRAPMLATLEPAVGSSHALWQSAVLFGVAHYFGTPGGLLGGVLSICMGWILGKAMLETRGLFWAWWIHFLSDIVIFVFIAVALAA